MGTLAAENLDVCIACDPWDSNIPQTANIPQMSLEQEIDDDIDIKILGVPPPGPGMPFLDSDTCAERWEGVIYFCQGFLPCMMPFMDGWRDGWMDGKSFTKNDHNVLTICNVLLCLCQPFTLHKTLNFALFVSIDYMTKATKYPLKWALGKH